MKKEWIRRKKTGERGYSAGKKRASSFLCQLTEEGYMKGVYHRGKHGTGRQLPPVLCRDGSGAVIAARGFVLLVRVGILALGLVVVLGLITCVGMVAT